MSTYKVRTAALLLHLQKMQTVQEEDNVSNCESDIDQPLRKTIPCGLKILSVRKNSDIFQTYTVCGKENLRRGYTSLCFDCHDLFKQALAEAAETHSTTSIEQMEIYAEVKPLSFFEKCKKFAQTHPYIASAAITFPVVCGLMAYGLSAAQATPSEDSAAIGGSKSQFTPTPSLTTDQTTMVSAEPSEFTTEATIDPDTIATTTAEPTTTTVLTTVPTTKASTTLTTTQATTEQPSTAKAETTKQATTKQASTTRAETTKQPATKQTSTTKPEKIKHFVAVKAGTERKDDTVIVTTKEFAPKSCYSSKAAYQYIPDHDGHAKFTYIGTQVKNNCQKPLVVTPVKPQLVKGKFVANGKICLVEVGQTKDCYGPENTGFTHHLGSNISFKLLSKPRPDKPAVAELTKDNDVVVTLTTPSTRVLGPGLSTSCMKKIGVTSSVPGKPIHKVGHVPIYKNTCSVPVLFSVVSRLGDASTTRTLVNSGAQKIVREKKIKILKENKVVPKVVQKPPFVQL